MRKKDKSKDQVLPDFIDNGMLSSDSVNFSEEELRKELQSEDILSEDIFGDVDLLDNDDDLEKKNQIAKDRQQENLEAAEKKVKKVKKAKWYHIVALILFILLLVIFGGWHIKKKRIMNITLLDKTVLSYSEDNDIIKETVYRKHQGFYWILEQQKYVKKDGSFYDFKKDYYGPMLDEEGSYKENVFLKSVAEAPDLMYVADSYGVVDDTFGYFRGDDPNLSGISQDDMSVISFAYESGATVIAETALFSMPMEESVYSQMTSMCGVTPTTWVGRYIFDLQDFSDVPDWAPPMYEQQEGVEWRFSGPGILLVSREGKIIVLEQNIDFDSKNLLKIYINKEYRKEFAGVSNANFYNWFELVEPNYGTEQIATFEFDLNVTGMEKIREVSNTPRFAAVTRKVTENHAPVYFFSGDFNDYTSGHKYGRFLFANQIFKLFSFDRQGDVTNFFWNFYDPLIRKILSDTNSQQYEDENTDHKEISRVRDEKFQIYRDEEWSDIDVKAVSINAIEPGTEQYSRDLSYYEKLIELAEQMGANCICAKTLLPPEFYSAIYKHNKGAQSPMYIMQTVTAPEDLHPSKYLSEEGLSAWKAQIEQAVCAVHGDGSAKNEYMSDAVYFTDASAYLIAVTIDPTLDVKTCYTMRDISQYSYDGKYTKPHIGMSAFCSYLYDTAQSVSYDKYEYFTPVAVRSHMNMLRETGLSYSAQAYLFSDIVTDEVELYFYNDVFFDKSLTEQARYIKMDKYDAELSIFSDVKSHLGAYILSGITYSDTSAVFDKAAVTEADQGNMIVNTLAAARDAVLPGTVIYDLNDTWYDVSLDMRSATVPYSNKHMWHNVCDEEEMTGVVAAEAVYPEKAGLVLSDDDRAQRISVYSNEEYMYITLELPDEIDYKSETMFIGLDTFQRNDGEYFYSSKFTMNSLSGMEYVLAFRGKQDLTLYCIPSYNRTKDHAYTTEAYKGKFSKVAKLSYGGFNVADNQFYQTSSTIYIRLPWTWLNVSDPSNRLVLSDKGPLSDQPSTVITNGMLLSVMIGENSTGDMMYAFPETKHDPGYKMFKWSPWEKVSYGFRQKDSYTIVQKFYTASQGE